MAHATPARYAPHATEQTRLAEVVSGTESRMTPSVDRRLKLPDSI